MTALPHLDAVAAATDHAAPARTAATLAAVFAGARWQDVRRLRDALPDLPHNLLLHAGPAYGDQAVPAPVRHAAAHAIVYEGAAESMAQAFELIDNGTYRFAPAQDYGVVTPLAQVVTFGMPVLVVGDGVTAAYAPIAEGPPPALRFGSPDPVCVANMQSMSTLVLGPVARAVRAAPVALNAVIESALQGQDECHARTGAANAALLTQLPAMDDASRAVLAAHPGFVLTLIMAASAWVLRYGQGPLLCAGGNGLAFGIRMKTETVWRTVAATPPVGNHFPAHAASTPMGAIGDSAVIDCCGLGGQAIAFAPALLEEWAASLPADAAARGAQVIDPATGVIDPARIAATGHAPAIHLAMVDRAGMAGLIGRGVYTPPVSLFAPKDLS
ncbi:DUF1116 domain-containing protein [Alcaligenaceae bacterium B3P038]|nr:DUF1116 domain-containing protein [Alcaligenaceae bacterium B3P038]